MNNVLKIVLEYLIVFIMIFLLGLIMSTGKKKKITKNNMPIELAYLIFLYKIDMKVINLKSFKYVYNFINAFIISTIYIIVIYLIEKLILQILIGIVLLILLIIICYGLLARYYERKMEKCIVQKK